METMDLPIHPHCRPFYMIMERSDTPGRNQKMRLSNSFMNEEYITSGMKAILTFVEYFLAKIAILIYSAFAD